MRRRRAPGAPVVVPDVELLEIAEGAGAEPCVEIREGGGGGGGVG